MGAGIAGLAAAWELARAGPRGGGSDVTILESERRPGGVVVTERVDGFLVEGGPDGFLASEPELPALAKEVDIGDRVIDQRERGTSLWSGGELQPIDAGRAAVLLGIDAKASDVAAGFRSFAGGMGELVMAVAQRLSGSLRLAQGVAGIAREGKGWRLAITGGSAHEADGIVLTLPAYTAGRLLEGIGVAGARELAEVVYAPSITVSLAYREADIGRPLSGAGFVVESPAPDQIRACTYASQKFPGRAPEGHALLRAYLGPTDDHPAKLAREQLASILAIRGEPLWSRVYFWTRGLPRYRARHADLVASIRRRLERLPPLAIAGAGYDGAGVSACVRSGRAAARLIAQRTAR
ncbi:MAG TPA: FAD-dependent oxidoreductase [Gemmatimonadales bacterium]|nr:FAD-dependent oxidoreductase [Gemmatimonadales bacterium]